jgi:hypothetical protein
MSPLFEFVLEPVRQSADFILYRGKQHGNASPVLVVALASDQRRARLSGGSSTNTRSRPISIRLGQRGLWS